MFGLIRPDELQKTYGWVAEVLHRREERQHMAEVDEKEGDNSFRDKMHGNSAKKIFRVPLSRFSSIPARSKAPSLECTPSFEGATHLSSSSHLHKRYERRQRSVHDKTGSRPFSSSMSPPWLPPSSLLLDPDVLVQKAISLPCVGHERISKDESTSRGHVPDSCQVPKANSFMSISFVRDHDLCPVYFHLALLKLRNETCG